MIYRRLFRAHLVILRQKLVRAGQPCAGRAVVGMAADCLFRFFRCYVSLAGDLMEHPESALACVQNEAQAMLDDASLIINFTDLYGATAGCTEQSINGLF